MCTVTNTSPFLITVAGAETLARPFVAETRNEYYAVLVGASVAIVRIV